MSIELKTVHQCIKGDSGITVKSFNLYKTSFQISVQYSGHHA